MYRWTKITDPDVKLLAGDQLCRAGVVWGPASIHDQPNSRLMKDGNHEYFTRTSVSASTASPLRDWRRWLGDGEAVIWRDLDRPEHIASAAASDGAAQVAPQRTVIITAPLAAQAAQAAAKPIPNWQPVTITPGVSTLMQLGDVVTVLGKWAPAHPSFPLRDQPDSDALIANPQKWGYYTIGADWAGCALSTLQLVLDKPILLYRDLNRGVAHVAPPPTTARWRMVSNGPSSMELHLGDIIARSDTPLSNLAALPPQRQVDPFRTGERPYLTVSTSEVGGNGWAGSTVKAFCKMMGASALTVYRKARSDSDDADDYEYPSPAPQGVQAGNPAAAHEPRWTRIDTGVNPPAYIYLRMGDVIVKGEICIPFSTTLPKQPDVQPFLKGQKLYLTVDTYSPSTDKGNCWGDGSHTLADLRATLSRDDLSVWRDANAEMDESVPLDEDDSPVDAAAPVPTANPYQWTRLDTSTPESLAQPLKRGDVIVRAGDPVCRGSPFPEQDDVRAMKIGKKTYVTISSWSKTIQGARDYIGNQTLEVYRDVNPDTVGVWSGIEAPKAPRREYHWVRLPDSDPALTYLTKGDMVVRAGGSFKPIHGWRPDEKKVSTMRLHSGEHSYAILTQSYDLSYLRAATSMDDLIAYRDSTYPKVSVTRRSSLSSLSSFRSSTIDYASISWDGDPPKPAKVALRSKGNDHQAVPLPLP